MLSDTKNQKIKSSKLTTRERRKSQICRTFEVKIDFSRANKVQKTYLNNIFLEAKWFYNDILRTNNVFEYDYKTIEVLRKNKDGEFISQRLNFLTSSLRQSILDLTKTNIYALNQSKKRGRKVGRLKFKSEYNSINFKQYGITHKIINDKSIKLQGLKKPLFVRGLKQLPQNCEFSNFKLIRRASGFYILITTFSSKEEKNKFSSKKDSVGLDFGIKTMITTSDAKSYDVNISESQKLKSYSRKFNKAKKGSKNKYKLRRKLRLEYEKLGRKKNDRANKVVAELFSNYEEIYFQNENITGWEKRFGRKVQHSCLGRIKSKLRNDVRATMIGRFEPTTKRCYCCGTINHLELSDRIFICKKCNYQLDRDVKSAIMIKIIGKRVRYGAYQTSDDIIFGIEKIDYENRIIEIAYGVIISAEDIKVIFDNDNVSYNIEVRRC